VKNDENLGDNLSREEFNDPLIAEAGTHQGYYGNISIADRRLIPRQAPLTIRFW
jgi:hypothetical protein